MSANRVPNGVVFDLVIYATNEHILSVSFIVRIVKISCRRPIPFLTLFSSSRCDKRDDPSEFFEKGCIFSFRILDALYLPFFFFTTGFSHDGPSSSHYSTSDSDGDGEWGEESDMNS